jgi:UDP-N-acetylglucosamine---dolichyl-phosphate N-acetylglucosaminyltransferase
MSKKTALCIIIPAYNEGEVIGTVIQALNRTFVDNGFKPAIVVVDDGSKDDTGHAARKAGATVITHILNSGSGGATATGLSYAQQQGFEIAATVDADGQHDPKDVLQGVKLMIKGEHDLLIGSRLINSKGMSRAKRLGNKGLSVITRLLFGVNVTDSQSGLRIFSKRALNELKWKTSGYEFCSEMLWRAKQQKMHIGEYPIKAIYTEYSKSKGQNNWNAFNIIKSLLRRRIMELMGE